MPPINYYPYAPYTNYQYLPQIQYTPPAQPQNQQISTGILWVANEQEAQTYPVAPNNAVALWDSANPIIYLKQADAAGKPNIKIYELKERIDPSIAAPEKIDTSNFIERPELDGFRSDFESIKSELKTLKKEIISLKRKHEELEDD